MKITEDLPYFVRFVHEVELLDDKTFRVNCRKAQGTESISHRYSSIYCGW